MNQQAIPIRHLNILYQNKQRLYLLDISEARVSNTEPLFINLLAVDGGSVASIKRRKFSPSEPEFRVLARYSRQREIAGLLAEFSSTALIRNVCQSSLSLVHPPSLLFPLSPWLIFQRLFSHPHYVSAELKGAERSRQNGQNVDPMATKRLFVLEATGVAA